MLGAASNEKSRDSLILEGGGRAVSRVSFHYASRCFKRREKRLEMGSGWVLWADSGNDRRLFREVVAVDVVVV